MSRRNFKNNLVVLLACSALLLAALGCESVTGPTPTNDSTLSSPSDGGSLAIIDNVTG